MITRPFKSRVYGDTIIGLARAIRDGEGGFRGVALAAVSPEAFDLLGDLPNLPPGSAISINRRDGINLFRAPLLPDQLGRDLSATPLFAQALPSAPAGIAVTGPGGSLMDGESRILAYRTLESWPLVVVVGVPRAAIVADWRQDWTRNAMLVGMALIGFSWLATIVQRQVTGRLEAELALSRQELEYRAKVEEELRRWATTDALTGLANRRHFMDKCEREMQRALRYARPMAVAIFDVDLFKRINDGYGHAVGDEALKAIARTAAAALRETDLTGRLGGEEFGLMLPETDLAGAADLAERLRAAIARIAFEAHGQPIPLRISIGVAALLSEDASVDALFARADQALYRAKHLGRDRVALAEAPSTDSLDPHI
ncbi:MAG: diguanylate cyclase [Magnetospirillum sp.]|nr:diguanylate cyclase [Magnetospirillum sp.]